MFLITFVYLVPSDESLVLCIKTIIPDNYIIDYSTNPQPIIQRVVKALKFTFFISYYVKLNAVLYYIMNNCRPETGDKHLLR